MTDGMSDARKHEAEAPLDPARAEEFIRKALDSSTIATDFRVPRVYLVAILQKLDGARDVARLVEGAPSREEWSGP